LTGASARAGENPVFVCTHLLPSPYTIPAGRLSYGSSFSLGVTDFMQIGTNAWLDAYRVWNGDVKLSLLDYRNFALSLTGEVLYYNLADMDPRNPSMQITSWQPGAVAAFGFLERFAIFGGITLDLREAKAPTGIVATSGYTPGARLEADAAFMYGDPKRHGIGNAFSAGITYDATYQLFGFGFGHHWPGFHLGIHYYPGADQNRILPILTGGGTVQL
jgi:hypothetical protein